MKKILLYCLVFTAVFIGSFLYLKPRPVVHAQTPLTPAQIHANLAAAKPVPSYTIHYREFVNEGGDKADILAMEKTVARRADGSKAIRKTNYAKDPKDHYTEGQLFLANDVYEVYMEEAGVRSRVQIPGFSRGQALKAFDPLSKCVTSYNGGGSVQPATVSPKQDIVLGYTTFVLTQGKNGDFASITQWKAPDLGCELLKQEVTWTNGHGPSRLVPVSIIIGEPDPALLDEKPGYPNLAPSLMDAAKLAQLHVTLSGTQTDRLAMFKDSDARFQEYRNP
jgi:hypothetical protein